MLRTTLLATAATIIMVTGSGCCCMNDVFTCGSACGNPGAIGCDSCGGGCSSCDSGCATNCNSGCDTCSHDDCGGCHGRKFLLFDYLRSEWGCLDCSFLGLGCCGDDCGETYLGGYASDPPARCEPCDHHGQWVGPSTYRRRHSHKGVPVGHETVIEGEVISGPTLAPTTAPATTTTPRSGSSTAPQWRPRSSQP